MTPEQRKLSQSLIVSPLVGGRQISKEAFLRQFPSAVDEKMLSFALLEKSYRDRNAEDLQCALIIGYAFGFSSKHEDILCLLISADWHFSHEDIVSALVNMHSPKSIDALYQATQWIPAYLDFDESRALAVKAIWALGGIAGVAAEHKLIKISKSSDSILRENAENQLQRRKSKLL